MRRELVLMRERMAEYGVDACIVPDSDFHSSEYVGEYFKCREYISGFTGSAGILLVMKEEADLWTDGRYFLQARNQLDGTGIRLQKMGEPGVLTIQDYLASKLSAGQTVCVDGRCLTTVRKEEIETALKEKGIFLRCDLDLPGEVWKERGELAFKDCWELPLAYAGVSRKDKLAMMRDFLKEKGADYLLLTSLTQICWLLNIRGDDVESTPVVLSYLLVGLKESLWFCGTSLSDDMKGRLSADGVYPRPYHDIYDMLPGIIQSRKVCLDKNQVNASLYQIVSTHAQAVAVTSPAALEKARKNPVERMNFRKAHEKDGTAVSKFIFWLKLHVSEGNITEMGAADHLRELRKAQEHFVEESFAPIIAYGPHGAIIHYSATPETDAVIEPGGFVLADTGGHYLEGTTDITRTISTGALTREEKVMYTLVLKSHIDLAKARFIRGTRGSCLDVLARQPLWERNLDYNHGTGHGVGYLLSVHEGPINISCRRNSRPDQDCPLEEGMVTSNEPGIYLEGKFGIRLENLVMCEQDAVNSCGCFLRFDTMTLVPFDRAAILPDMLDDKEIAWLNAYHQEVFEKISPHLSARERAWLREETAPFLRD